MASNNVSRTLRTWHSLKTPLLNAVSDQQDAKHVLIVSDSINQLDACGEEVLHHLIERLRSNGISVIFSGLNKQVLDVMHNYGLWEWE